MREIKFRAKTHLNDEWLYSTGIDITEGGNEIKMVYGDTEMSDVWLNVIPESLGQYIGLKDINGKEIYEGDIVELIFEEDGETLTGKGIVKYLDDWTGFFCVLFDGNCTSSILNPRVIGNIYENKELLEVK